jgi:hypothetical protein
MLLTVLVFVGEMRHIWRYSINELDKGLEEWGFILRNSRPVHETSGAEYIRRDTLQGIACHLGGLIELTGSKKRRRHHLKYINYLD